jgi:homoserine O-acetyltransferase/O-succinyltransferase
MACRATASQVFRRATRFHDGLLFGEPSRRRVSLLAGSSLGGLATSRTLPSASGAPRGQGSGIGTDVEMIAANDRLQLCRLDITLRSFGTNSTSDGAMKDEYGTMDDAGDTYVHPGDFVLENGQKLPAAQLRYQTYGTLNTNRDNVLVVCHALTGNASLHSWWGELLGPGRPFDTDKYLVVCCNILGSCYGSTSPVSINPATGLAYGKDFPNISVQDTVRLQLFMLKNELMVASVKAVIGGSFGGMQAVEFAVQAGVVGGDFCHTHRNNDPFVRSVIPIACGAQHTAWQIAISEVQRQAIYSDPAWESADPFAATAGLEVARQIGMVSYRTASGYVNKFGRSLAVEGAPAYGSSTPWQVKSYLEYQGQKFLTRFDPVTYVKMTEQMDSHDVTRGRSHDILSRVEIPVLVLGIDSDVLYPVVEQEDLARSLSRSELKIIHSVHGHDGFLLEQEQVAAHISDFLDYHD